uniref:Uncharacterized protein n=1 Tax=Ditylenchus dipsaci TaxID=166011 RepID=A0A915EKU4_9BILA
MGGDQLTEAPNSKAESNTTWGVLKWMTRSRVFKWWPAIQPPRSQPSGRVRLVLRAACAGGAVTDWTLYDTCYTERYMGLPLGEGKNCTRGLECWVVWTLCRMKLEGC